MEKFVLFSGIILHYVRQINLFQKIKSELSLFSHKKVPVVASVSVGEIVCFVQHGQWGNKRIKRFKKLISKILVVDITAKEGQLVKLTTISGKSNNFFLDI